MNLPWVQQMGAVLPWRRTALFLRPYCMEYRLDVLLRLSRSTVKRALTDLEQHGYLQKIPRYRDANIIRSAAYWHTFQLFAVSISCER